MKKTTALNLASLVLVLVLALALTGCSKKLASSSSAEGNLEYGFSGHESFSYTQSSQAMQTIVYMGQEVNTSINSNMGFTAKGKGIVNGDLIIEISLDTLGISMNAMGTNMKEDVSELKGKSFMMTMSPKGADKDLDEAEKMTYTFAGIQSSNLKDSFTAVFPELPPVAKATIGYTWQDTDTITVNTETENAEIILTSNNTVEAREEVRGYDCYRISYLLSGTRDGSSQTPQGLVISNVDVSGTGYFYFAVKEGVIISDHSEIKTEGDVVIPTGESIPMYSTTTTEFNLR